jgi:hypothetical protein
MLRLMGRCLIKPPDWRSLTSSGKVSGLPSDNLYFADLSAEYVKTLSSEFEFVLTSRTQGGGTKGIRSNEAKGEITSFQPSYTRLAPAQSNNIVLPSSEVSMYLDKALKVLGLVSTLRVHVPHTDPIAYRSSNLLHHASPPFMIRYRRRLTI